MSALLLTALVTVAQSVPHVHEGSIRRFENFQSAFCTPRTIDVWLPEGYSPKKKYSVLYMHDGQMLYDSALTWNKQAWDVDDVVASLIRLKKIKDVIVVGIWNGGATRHIDYFPQKPFESLSPADRDTVSAQLQQAGRSSTGFQPVSDRYLQFMVTELKPFIDKMFSTLSDRAHTFIAGSSMGGLISLYAICEYPDVFGGAACMSTHWPGTFTVENNPMPTAFQQYLKAHLPDPATHAIYFDYGDQTLDALYPPLQQQVDVIMQQKHFSKSSWLTKYFPGEDHSERAWRKRLDVPLLFLLKR